MNTELSTDPDAPPPTFDVLPLSPELRQALDELGYTHPTPVQRVVYEPALRGRDVVVQARTGTGKTASFGMPVVDGLARTNVEGVQVVVLCPTRELALQVSREFEILVKYRGLRCVAVYGGAPMGRQIEELKAGAQVLIGTPGRVLDHLERGTLDPSNVRTLILDESDEMLSMGFLPQINEIDAQLPSPHQTLLFSATLPADIQRIAETRLRDPLFLTLSGDHIGALDIQHFVYLTRGDKLKELQQIIEVENPESAIVFTNTRDETKRVAAALERMGFAADWLNADLAQNDREKVMARTREGKLRFLVCTDVAARGIDISHLTHVINFDFPESPEGYVHRTGRTGRAGRTGTAISLVAPNNIGSLYMMRLTYKIFPIERQLPTSIELRSRAELDLVELFVDAFRSRPIHPDDLSLARRLLTHDAAQLVVAGLLRDHLGARPDAVRAATDARRAPSLPPRPPAVGVSTPSARPPRAAPTFPPPPSESAADPSGKPQAVPPELPRAQQDSRREFGDAGEANPSERREPRREPRSSGGRDRNRQARPEARRPQHPDSPRNDRRDTAACTAETGPSRDGEAEFEFAYTVSDVSPVETPKASGSPHSAETRSADRREPPRTNVARDETASPAPTPHAPLEPTGPEAPWRRTPQDLREIFVTVGRRDGATPQQLTEILDQAGVTEADRRYVRVRHNHAFVAVAPGAFDRALAALQGATVCGRQIAAEPSRAGSGS